MCTCVYQYGMSYIIKLAFNSCLMTKARVCYAYWCEQMCRHSTLTFITYTIHACIMFLHATTVLMCVVLSPLSEYIFVSSLVNCVTDAKAKEEAKEKAASGRCH